MVADAATHERPVVDRIGAALDRAETAAVALRADRDRAMARATAALAAGDEAVAAFDALVAGGR